MQVKVIPLISYNLAIYVYTPDYLEQQDEAGVFIFCWTHRSHGNVTSIEIKC